MKLSLNTVKVACVLTGLFVGATALAAGNLPTVKMVWGTAVPSAPVSLGIYTSMPGCSATGPVVQHKGSSFSQDLNKIPACAPATSMQAMVNYDNGKFVACHVDGHINIPLKGKNIMVTVTNFTYSSGGASAICKLEQPAN